MKIKLDKNIIGAYYYKYEERELVLLRLYKIKNNKYIFKDENRKKVILTKDQLSEFTQIKPDGVISHVVISDDNEGIDTACMLYRMSDLDKNNYYPYAICRQNVVDNFRTILSLSNDVVYVGISTNKNSCLNMVEFNELLISDNTNIKYITNSYIYKDDKLEDILSFVDTKIYDKALSLLKSFMDKDDDKEYIEFKSSYKEFLEYNDFMNDFINSFNIVRIYISIDNNVDRWKDKFYKLSHDDIRIIEDFSRHRLINPILIKYDKYIDITDIERDYIFFEDINKNLYIISYEKGPDIISSEYENLSGERKEEFDFLKRIICK